MKKAFPIILFTILAGLAVVYFIMGPSVFFGGPSKSTIVEVARTSAKEQLTGTASAVSIDRVDIKPKGMCSKMENGVFACMVDADISGEGAQTFIVQAKKDQNGNWVYAE